MDGLVFAPGRQADAARPPEERRGGIRADVVEHAGKHRRRTEPPLADESTQLVARPAGTVAAMRQLDYAEVLARVAPILFTRLLPERQPVAAVCVADAAGRGHGDERRRPDRHIRQV